MLRLIIAAALLATSVAAYAQQPADSLRKCLADNTSGKDRKDLAKWIFLAMAAHPEIRQYASSAAPSAATENSRTMAALVTRLMTDSCANETRNVMRAGGAQALQVAFENLGRLAMQELMADTAVNESMGLFARYMDQKRFNDLGLGK